MIQQLDFLARRVALPVASVGAAALVAKHLPSRTPNRKPISTRCQDVAKRSIAEDGGNQKQPSTFTARQFIGEDLNDRCIKIISYNVLADMYAMRNLAKHGSNCPAEELAWNRRKTRILHELLSYNADVLCLQEIQAQHYKEDFQPFLREKGYRAMYVLRTPWEHSKEGEPEDGIAVFWKESTVDVEEHSNVLFSYLANASSCCHLMNTQNHVNNISKEKGALIVSLLRHRQSNRQLLIGNTHLYHNPQHADIKVSQAYMAAVHMRNFAYMHRCSGLPSVLCGDFNSQPRLNRNEIDFNPNNVQITFSAGQASGVYELLSTGRLDTCHMHHPATWNPAKNAGMQAMELPDSQRFSSAYRLWCGVEPLFTTKTDQFKETIDYCWLSDAASSCLRGVLSGIPTEDKDVLRKNYSGKAQREIALATFSENNLFPVALPDPEFYPSDHIAIGCILQL